MEKHMDSSERKTRSDKGSVRWTERDLSVLRWIGEQYVIGLDQLQVLLVLPHER